MSDAVRDFIPSPEHYNAPYDKRSFEAGYQAAQAEAAALVDELVGALEDIVNKGTFNDKTTNGYGRGQNIYAVIASKALTKAQAWKEGAKDA